MIACDDVNVDVELRPIIQSRWCSVEARADGIRVGDATVAFLES